MQTIKSKTILQKAQFNSLDWFGIDYNMNLYRGCCHGCIYCDSRSNCYQIENFDTVRLKEDCISILASELRRKRKKGIVGIGAMSDTYNPFEREQNITRQALSLIHQNGFGVSLDTKSDLICRDADLLGAIGQQYGACAKLSITCAEDELSQRIEPGVCPSSARFKALKVLSAHNVFCGVLLTPILPYITDSEENILSILRRAADSGAKFAYSVFGVTLRENQRDHYYAKLDQLFPGLRQKYQTAFGPKYYCKPRRLDSLRQTFIAECKKLGLLYRMQDIIKAYKPRAPEGEQLNFLSL